MKADLDKIKWLMENQSIYSISKATGISQTTLGPYNLGQRDFGNMTLKNASTLTEYAEKLMEDYDNVDDRGASKTN